MGVLGTVLGLFLSAGALGAGCAKSNWEIRKMQEKAKASYGKGCDPGTEFALACDALKRINEYDKRLSDKIDGLKRYQIITDHFYSGTKWDDHLTMERSIHLSAEFNKNLACSIAAREMHSRGFCPIASSQTGRNFECWNPYARCSAFYEYLKENPTTEEFHYAMQQIRIFHYIPYEEFGKAAKPDDPVLITKEVEEQKRQEEWMKRPYKMITKKVIWK